MPLNDDEKSKLPQQELTQPLVDSEITVASKPDASRPDGTPPVSGTDYVSTAERAIRAHFAKKQLFVGADEDIRIAETAASSAEEIADVGITSAPTSAQVIDDIVLAGSSEKTSVLNAGLRKVLHVDAKIRQKQLISGVTCPLVAEAERDALAEIQRFAAATFEGEPEVPIAGSLKGITAGTEAAGF